MSIREIVLQCSVAGGHRKILPFKIRDDDSVISTVCLSNDYFFH